MSLDDGWSMRQLARLVTKTADGRTALAICAIAGLAIAGGLFALGVISDPIHASYAKKLIDVAVFSALATPFSYLALAYFSGDSRSSEIINALILVGANTYLVAQHIS